jgi:hypothetical protein
MYLKRAFAIALLTLFCTPASIPASVGQTFTPQAIQYPQSLQIGRRVYQGWGVVRLFNNTDKPMTVLRVLVSSLLPNGQYGEACAMLGSYEDQKDPPGQKNLAKGEIACTYRSADESKFPTLINNPIQVPPGEFLALNGYLGNQAWGNEYLQYIVVATGDEAQASIRQPINDHHPVLPCDNQTRNSAWEPVQNRSSKTWLITDVQIFAATGYSKSVQVGCAYVFNADGTLAIRRCGFQTRGNYSLEEPILVNPGQWLAGHAQYRCSPGQTANWAAFFKTSNMAATTNQP